MQKSFLRRCLLSIRKAAKNVQRTLFPAHCCVCNERLLDNEKHICFQCLLNLPYTHFRGAEGNIFERQFWGIMPIVRANAFLYYQRSEPSRFLFFQLKYEGNTPLGLFLGRQMAKDVLPSDFFNGIDAILPIPLHPSKRRKRGYNQSEILARGIQQITHLPIIADAVTRIKNTSTQTHLNAAQRKENMENAFLLVAPEKLRGKHILIVDDVLTTNATICACAKEAEKAGGVTFSVLTLGLAGRHPLRLHEFIDAEDFVQPYAHKYDADTDDSQT